MSSRISGPCLEDSKSEMSVAYGRVADKIRFNLRCGTVQEGKPTVFAQVWFALKTQSGRQVLSTSQDGGECNGCMDTAGRVALPAAFEHADIDNLALLIGNHSLSLLYLPPLTLMSKCHIEADMLERLIAHNDRIPLLP